MNRLIESIASDFKAYNERVFLVENRDKFLLRPDVIQTMKEMGLEVFYGSNIKQRIRYELREKNERLILVGYNLPNHLEDIKRNSKLISWKLEDYFPVYHRPSLDNLPLDLLEVLFLEKPYEEKNKEETLLEIERCKSVLRGKKTEVFVAERFMEAVENELKEDHLNWPVIMRLISDGLKDSIGTDDFTDVYKKVHEINELFQDELKKSYESSKTSSSVKKPTIVSNILDYLSFNFLNEKIALIVIDGMAFWQYLKLKESLGLKTKEEFIYSWIPSITELSRQAIFRGDTPVNDYNQGPESEKRLWFKFWKEKGVDSFEIDYQHNPKDLIDLQNISKLGIVFTHLDETMHKSDNYYQLSFFTKEWIKETQLGEIISRLNKTGFRIFFTTDHGNIQARGWEKLTQKEKKGMITLGSRGERFIEYPNHRFKEELLEEKPELKEYDAFREKDGVYFANDLSFSDKDVLVTHGGTHILEVLIPFIEISNER